MVTKKPRIVIIGAGMAGLTAANRLYTSPNSKHLFDLSVVEGGGRIGGRINSSEFCGDRIEQGATWIHGIEGSPVYKIAQETDSLVSNQPWECMDGILEDPVTIAEGGHLVSPSIVEPISILFKNLMDFIQGNPIEADEISGEVLKHCIRSGGGDSSVGAFLRRGLAAYWELEKKDKKGVGNWSRKSLEEGVFAMQESIQRTFTSADDLCSLDYDAERDYIMFPGEEVTIGRGYSSVIESLASVLPAGMVQLNRKVEKIEWDSCESHRPVKLHFADGSTVSADHVIVTVSLGVLKRGIESCMFNPPLPTAKNGAISRLGYGVVDKVFLQLTESNFPFLHMVFHPPDSHFRSPKIPQWIRRTSFLTPIYSNSRVVLSWFTGKEALELESLSEEDIINGFSSTLSNLLSPLKKQVEFDKVLRTQWGSNPLFLGSYTYIQVGSSIHDMDTLAEPLPENTNLESSPPLQILFAGEATHKTHYSTTHGAYFSGLREANRLLKHYNYIIGV
ncbi:hypothetical protein ACS0TY_021982 [Phlomoides rotata]